MSDDLVFNDEISATLAEREIAAIEGYPRVGVNAETGEPQPTKQQTTYWDVPQLRKDGKYAFAKPDSEKLSKYPPEFLQELSERHPYTVEERQSSLFDEDTKTKRG